MNTTTGNKTQRGLLIILAVVLVIGMAASCTLGALAVQRISKQEAQVTALSDALAAKSSGGDDHVTQEDDVPVAGQYMIRSTLPISDAYRSGDTSALSDTQKETLKMASDILDEIITDGMTPYEKEKAVYDWMCANLHHEGGVTAVIPTASEYSAEPFGVLKYRAAVCVGFATTFRMFMQMMDIECKVVHNSYHSWDLINLDGDWYHTDIYSDVERGNYANFNMTDEMCARGHDWDKSFFPAATGLKYCYAYMNAEKLDDIYKLPQLVRDGIDSGKLESMYFLTDGTDKDTVLAASELLSRLSDAVSQYGTMNGKETYIDWNAQQVDGKVLLSVLPYGTTESAGDALDDETRAQIDKAMEKAFGEVYSGDTPTDDGDWMYETDNAPTEEAAPV